MPLGCGGHCLEMALASIPQVEPCRRNHFGCWTANLVGWSPENMRHAVCNCHWLSRGTANTHNVQQVMLVLDATQWPIFFHDVPKQIDSKTCVVQWIDCHLYVGQVLDHMKQKRTNFRFFVNYNMFYHVLSKLIQILCCPPTDHKHKTKKNTVLLLSL